MAAGHLEAIALWPTEGEVRTAFGKTHEANRFALRIDNFDAVKVLGFAFQLEGFAITYICWL